MLTTVRWRQYVLDPIPHLYSKVYRDVLRSTGTLGTFQGLQGCNIPHNVPYNVPYNRPNHKVRYWLYPKPNNKVRYRYINVLKKTKDLMLITYLNPTYLWCFSPHPFCAHFRSIFVLLNNF